MKKEKQKRIIVSVTTDLVSDNRVHKVCTTLTNMGFNVFLVGRKLPTSLPLENRNYSTKRMSLLFKKGICFYAEFNFRLFLYLLFSRFDVLLSNDLDTLSANFLAARIKGKILVYDSHEYFTEVPELIHRPKVKSIWEGLEKKMVPKVDAAYTVCTSIAEIYTEKYKVPFNVVRNLPAGVALSKTQEKTAPNKMILYQGAINIGRGLKQAILAMHHIKNAQLFIAGDGDIKNDLEILVEQENLSEKVKFTGRLSIQQLSELTPTADLGLSIEEDLGLNYRFALPNKLFDYIQAQVPVLTTSLPEMAAIVVQYKIGETTDSLEPEILATKITDALENTEKRALWLVNLKKAAKELNWENEEKVLKSVYSQFL